MNELVHNFITNGCREAAICFSNDFFRYVTIDSVGDLFAPPNLYVPNLYLHGVLKLDK